MKKQTIFQVAAVLFCCAAMLWVDGIWQPGYWVKSGVKIALFLAIPLFCSMLCKDVSLSHLFRFFPKGLPRALALGTAVYLIILGGYLLLQSTVDFSGVLDNLPEGVTKATFPFVALYISFVNSLLEEFFFRGFAYLSLSERLHEASLFSAVAFALYHTAMMLGWFPLPVFLLALAGLTAGGLLFNWLNRRDGTIWTSWLVHMFANFGINTVGFLLFSQI